MAKNRLFDYENGAVLDHQSSCWRMDTHIVNKWDTFVQAKSDVTAVCGQCEFTSLCKALLSDSDKPLHNKPSKTNANVYKPVEKKPVRGKKKRK